MKASNHEKPETSAAIRATRSSYVALCGIWVVLSVGYCGLFIWKPGPGLINVALLTGGIGILWGCWLRGFRLALTESELIYRDGLYRTSRIPLADVKGHRFDWAERKILNRTIATPVLVVSSRQGGHDLIINPKPFNLRGLHGLLDALSKVAPTE